MSENEATSEPKAEPKDTQVKPEKRSEIKEEPKRAIKTELRAQMKKPERGERSTKSEPKEAKESKSFEPKKEEEAAPVTTPDIEPILPPGDMTAEEKVEFAKLSPQAQRYISRRAYQTQSDYTKRMEATTAKEREFEALAGINLRAVRDEYARYNIPLPTIIENAVSWDKAFRANPQQAAREYLAAWGIDPRTLITNPQQVHPQLHPAQIEEMVTSRVNAALEQERQSAYTQSTYSEVESFKKDKPLFKDPGTAAQLEATMAPIVAGLRSQNLSRAPREILDEAYNLVTRGNPQFAELLTKVDARAAAEKARAEAEKAQAASRSVSGGPGSGTPTKKHKSIRDALRAAYHQ